MATRDSRYEVPNWAAALAILLVVAYAAYVIVYGGSAATPLLALFWTIGLGLSVFTVYLAYRFVLAVEEIARKH